LDKGKGVGITMGEHVHEQVERASGKKWEEVSIKIDVS
jgi:hypothetical protein